MNYSIVTPGKCAAKCPFCIQERKIKESENYLSFFEKEMQMLSSVANDDLQISITSGEPTDYLGLEQMLSLLCKKRPILKKIVLTTNGSKLIKKTVCYCSLC